jgi:hypothetical protein
MIMLFEPELAAHVFGTTRIPDPAVGSAVVLRVWGHVSLMGSIGIPSWYVVFHISKSVITTPSEANVKVCAVLDVCKILVLYLLSRYRVEVPAPPTIVHGLVIVVSAAVTL